MTGVGSTAVPVGLTSAEAHGRLERDGPNRLTSAPRAPWLRRFAALADPMVLLLLVAAPIYLAIGERSDAAVVALAVLPIAAVGWVLESRAERTLERLRDLTARTATVTRDGHRVAVPADTVVVGDLCWLREGDIVPADAELVELTELTIDESALTGEALPVAKAGGDRVYAGTTVLSGRANAVVTATGVHTEYGAIGGLVASAVAPRTPLQIAVGRLVRTLALVAAGACVAVVAIERLHGDGWGDALIAGVSLAIATIPAEFPMVYTLYLALGAWRLAGDRALVRRLPSVETLGATTVICTDKTGTLTEGRLTIGEVVGDDAEEVLVTALLASEPDPYDPLERAIASYAHDHGVDVAEVHGGALVTDYPFDPRGRYLTHVWRMPDGTHRVAAKGAVETLAGGRFLAAHDRLVDLGMRVIATAAGTLPGGPSGDRATDEAALRPVGLVAFDDPVRPGVDDALARCRAAGIRVVMITGDHPGTAHAVTEGLGLPHTGPAGGDLIITGEELQAASDEQLDAIVADANVYARTRPEQKHRLVQAFRRRHEVVAMTGDGINDAPSLRAADIGIAMGDRGTEVAREAATMVLLDDNFTTIVGAIAIGRQIFDSLRRAFIYLVAFHPPLLLAALVLPLLGKPLLLLPVQLILLQILLQPIVSLVFESDPPDTDLMTRPPRDPSAHLLGRDSLRPLLLGVTLAGAVLASYLVALRAWPVAEARAFAFVTLLLGELGLLLVTRGLLRRPTRVLGVIVAIYLAIVVAIVEVPALTRLFKLEPFPAAGWIAAVLIACAATLWSQLLPPSEAR